MKQFVSVSVSVKHCFSSQSPEHALRGPGLSRSRCNIPCFTATSHGAAQAYPSLARMAQVARAAQVPCICSPLLIEPPQPLRKF